MLEVKNVRKSFHRLEVLKGVDLTVDQGDVVAIWAPAVRERLRSCGASIFWRRLTRERWSLTESIFP